MKTREEYIALIASHAEELQNTFGITSLRLFGSVARNEHHEGSDVDVFVEMPPKFFLVVRLKAYLEELLDNPVDIIRKHQHLNPILLKEIERDGIEVIAERQMGDTNRQTSYSIFKRNSSIHPLFSSVNESFLTKTQKKKAKNLHKREIFLIFAAN